jgi:hypothetical protein
VQDRQRIDVQGRILDSDKIAGWRADFCGAKRFGGRLIESHRESRGNGAGSAGRIVNSDAAETFAGHVTVEKTAQRFRSDYVGGRLDRFSDVFRDDGGAPGQFVAQIPAFGANLENRVTERDARDADSQWQNKI